MRIWRRCVLDGYWMCEWMTKQTSQLWLEAMKRSCSNHVQIQYLPTSGKHEQWVLRHWHNPQITYNDWHRNSPRSTQNWKVALAETRRIKCSDSQCDRARTYPHELNHKLARTSFRPDYRFRERYKLGADSTAIAPFCRTAYIRCHAIAASIPPACCRGRPPSQRHSSAQALRSSQEAERGAGVPPAYLASTAALAASSAQV